MNFRGRKQRPEGSLHRYLCGAAAALLSLALFMSLFYRAQGKPGGQEAEIVVFGDSVMGEVRDGTAVSALLEAKLGRSVYNAGMGGTCAARTERGQSLNYIWGVFSLAELAKAVETDDFGVQQSVVMRESNTEYFGEVIDGLEGLDFSGVDIILIQHGLNDYQLGTPIENPENPYDDQTFLGALRSAVSSFRNRNPEVLVVFVTPLFTWYTDARQATCEAEDYGGGVLEDYVNAEISLAEELGIHVIDMYHDFFPHGEWEDWRLYSRDGMHPNEAGREKMAGRIAEYLERNGY